MSESRRSRREECKQRQREEKKARKELHRRQKEGGLKSPAKPTIANCLSRHETTEEEQAERQNVVEEQAKIYWNRMPWLLQRLSKIADPRNPKTCKHKLTVILLYGLLMFVFQYGSRREANRNMSRPMFTENLRQLFPELETLPHHDTLNRVLSMIDVEQIETLLPEEVNRLIRQKKLKRYLNEHRYLVAIDGTQKFVRDHCWSEECLQRRIKGEEGERAQYYVSVLEANLVFSNGFSLPLLTEFLEYGEGDSLERKQDCERKAFRRLAERLKKYFPRLSIMLLLDGLYPNGPVFELCRKYNWDFMIVLQNDSLPSVWEDAYGLRKLQKDNTLDQKWGDREQHFWWVNDIEYWYGKNERQKQKLHLVVCEERYEEIDRSSGTIVRKSSRHAWVSGQPLSRENVHGRCNKAARYRWGIENSFLVEKRHGYQYEHCFSYNWNAMKGFHYLMRLAHFLNALAHRSLYLAEKIRSMGVRGLIQFFRETLSGPWLDAQRILYLHTKNHQLRLE